jgi:hypothetical protein
MPKNEISVPLEFIEDIILTLRRQRVMLDRDLAALYGVSTKVFNQAVKRNERKFPADFRFQLTKEEKQEVVTNCDHLKTLKYSPVSPYAFTEHGALMAANVLNSDQANSMSVYIVRAFVRLRETILGNSKLALKLMDVEKRLDRHDESINALVNAIECLLDEPEEKTKKRRMGFIVEEE